MPHIKKIFYIAVIAAFNMVNAVAQTEEASLFSSDQYPDFLDLRIGQDHQIARLSIICGTACSLIDTQNKGAFFVEGVSAGRFSGQKVNLGSGSQDVFSSITFSDSETGMFVEIDYKDKGEIYYADCGNGMSLCFDVHYQRKQISPTLIPAKPVNAKQDLAKQKQHDEKIASYAKLDKDNAKPKVLKPKEAPKQGSKSEPNIIQTAASKINQPIDKEIFPYGNHLKLVTKDHYNVKFCNQMAQQVIRDAWNMKAFRSTIGCKAARGEFNTAERMLNKYRKLNAKDSQAIRMAEIIKILQQNAPNYHALKASGKLKTQAKIQQELRDDAKVQNATLKTKTPKSKSSNTTQESE